jgi:hypothetical protein
MPYTTALHSVLFQGSELCYCHTPYIVLLCEDQHVVCHLLRLKSKLFRCLPQATFIAYKLIIVCEFRERFLYSWRRSLLHIKKHEFCAEWHILICRVTATRFGTRCDPLYVMDFVTFGSGHLCCRKILLIALTELVSPPFYLFPPVCFTQRFIACPSFLSHVLPSPFRRIPHVCAVFSRGSGFKCYRTWWHCRNLMLCRTELSFPIQNRC